MRKLAIPFLALALLAIGLTATKSDAASLTNKTYTTARKAALGGTAYHWNKAVGYGRYHTSDLKITKVIKDTGPRQKFKVEAKDGSRSKTATVKKDGYRKFRAFIPNRYVYTPPNSGQ